MTIETGNPHQDYIRLLIMERDELRQETEILTREREALRSERDVLQKKLDSPAPDGNLEILFKLFEIHLLDPATRDRTRLKDVLFTRVSSTIDAYFADQRIVMTKSGPMGQVQPGQEMSMSRPLMPTPGSLPPIRTGPVTYPEVHDAS